jgi:uncharacterized small protein (DUF1192 family)
MKNRKKLLITIALVVTAAGGLSTWAITQTKQKPRRVKTVYLEAFFKRYVAALNSNDIKAMMSFYGPDTVTSMAWGAEMDNIKRAAYFAACRESFPESVMEARKVIYEPFTETSGTITWEFGLKAGRQVKPFMGAFNRVENAQKIDGYDQVGVSTGYVSTLDRADLQEIRELEERVAALDAEIESLEGKIASVNEKIGSEAGPNDTADGEASTYAAERFSLAQQRAEAVEQRAAANQRLIDRAVSKIKFIRQSSFQNMDAFLKKIGGK